MRIKFWGTRGSIPTPGRKTEKYGGNTSCVEIRTSDGDILVCDAGTGIRELGQSLIQEFKDKRIEAHVFITHTHWDHIQGIPFFTPAFMPGHSFTFHGPTNIEQALHGQMVNQYFPVPLTAMGSKLQFVAIETGSSYEVSQVKITTAPLTHPGGAIGYRFDHKGRSVAYVTDNELTPFIPQEKPLPKNVESLIQFVKGVDLLVADTQYTRDEYPLKQGWGHSVVDDVLRAASLAEVKTLALFHHDPTHSDEFMEAVFRNKVEELNREGGNLNVFVGREGLAIQL